MKELVERLKEIKLEQDKLSNEYSEIVNKLEDFVAYENEDTTWTRFTKIDNLKELEEKSLVYRSNAFPRYSTKLEVLKNKPKELKEEKIEEEKV